MKYWYNHEKDALHGFNPAIEHDEFLKRPEHAHKLGISKEDATKWNVGRTKATMFSGKKPPLFVYSQEPYDKEMKDKVFKANTRINVVPRGQSDFIKNMHQISVHTHSLKEFPHAQMAVLKILDKHGFDPDDTLVHHETVVNGQDDIALAVPARDYVTTNSARKMWSRHSKLESLTDSLIHMILEGVDVGQALTESSAIIYHHFYNPFSKELR